MLAEKSEPFMAQSQPFFGGLEPFYRRYQRVSGN
jgi:hypothetical protein